MRSDPTGDRIRITTPGGGRIGRAKAGVDRRTTRPMHPWTDGQVARIDRSIRDATVERFHDDHEQPRHHLSEAISADDFGRRLRTPKELTSCAVDRKRWETEPERFDPDLLHRMPAPSAT